MLCDLLQKAEKRGAIGMRKPLIGVLSTTLCLPVLQCALELNMDTLEPIARKSEFSAFYAFLPHNLNFSLNDLQNAKTPKLAKYIRK
jgi:hypothetical protein